MTLGNGLLTSEDDFWLRQRRIAQPAFHRQRIAALADIMIRSAREVAARWDEFASAGRPVDIEGEMMRLTRTVVLRALLGGDLGPYASHIDEAWVVINQHIGESFWSLGLTEWLPTPRRRRFEAARTLLREAVDYVIAQRRRDPSDTADLLSMLLAARDEETGEGMTDEQLRVEVTTFLLAGQETTALALTWTWYLLSQPEVVFAGQQTVAERHPQFVVERTLVVVARVVLEDVPDIGRIRDQKPASRRDLEVHDIAIATRRVEENAGRIAPHCGQHAEERHPARPRWEQVACTRGGDHVTLPRRCPRTGLADRQGAVQVKLAASCSVPGLPVNLGHFGHSHSGRERLALGFPSIAVSPEGVLPFSTQSWSTVRLSNLALNGPKP
jgi:hypothetical protein